MVSITSSDSSLFVLNGSVGDGIFFFCQIGVVVWNMFCDDVCSVKGLMSQKGVLISDKKHVCWRDMSG